MSPLVDGVVVFGAGQGVYGAIRRLVEEGLNPEQVADVVIRDLNQDGIYDFARRWVGEEARAIGRRLEREGEARWRRELATAERQKETPEMRSQRLNRLADERAAARKAGMTVAAWRGQQRDEELARSVAKLEATLKKAFRAVEFTDEFLNSTFALPNGKKVTWLDATVEEHEQTDHHAPAARSVYRRNAGPPP